MNDQSPIITFSADAIVSKYLELREYRKEQDKAHEERMKPYADAMQALEGAADLLMKQTGQKALSTQHGTAYYSNGLSVSCEDRDVFLDFVFSHNARQFLTTHVAKEAVQAYMEPEGQIPPGLKVQPVIKVNFRKS